MCERLPFFLPSSLRSRVPPVQVLPTAWSGVQWCRWTAPHQAPVRPTGATASSSATTTTMTTRPRARPSLASPQAAPTYPNRVSHRPPSRRAAAASLQCSRGASPQIPRAPLPPSRSAPRRRPCSPPTSSAPPAPRPPLPRPSHAATLIVLVPKAVCFHCAVSLSFPPSVNNTVTIVTTSLSLSHHSNNSGRHTCRVSRTTPLR